MVGVLRVDAYIRVSKVAGRSGESFQSPSEQRRATHAWAAANGFEIAEVFEELDESGGRHDRPKLLQAIARAEQGLTDGVVVAYLDRFFRSQIHGLQAAQRLRDAGRFFASADGVDTRDDRSALMLGIRLAIAEDERERKRQDFDNAVRDAVARGIHRCPVAPFGYAKRGDKILEPVAREAPIVREVYERAARGESWAIIARWMESRGCVTRYGGTSWTSRAIRDLVRNRVYLGEARNGEHVNAHAHPPLIDELTFRHAQRVGRSFTASRSENPALLSGLIRCAGCRHGMQSYMSPRGREYRCRRRYAAGMCDAPAYVEAASIEPYVESLLFAEIDKVDPDAPVDGSRRDELERAARVAEADLVAFRDDPHILAALGAEDFAAGVKARREAFEAAQDRLVAYKASEAPAFDAVELRELWPELTVIEKRGALALVFDSIFVLRGRSRHDSVAGFTRAFARGQGPRDLPRRGGGRGLPIRALGEDSA